MLDGTFSAPWLNWCWRRDSKYRKRKNIRDHSSQYSRSWAASLSSVILMTYKCRFLSDGMYVWIFQISWYILKLIGKCCWPLHVLTCVNFGLNIQHTEKIMVLFPVRSSCNKLLLSLTDEATVVWPIFFACLPYDAFLNLTWLVLKMNKVYSSNCNRCLILNVAILVKKFEKLIYFIG